MNGDLQIIRVELKYCEACGALRLRARGSKAPYCSRCTAVMSQLPRTTRAAAPAERKRA